MGKCMQVIGVSAEEACKQGRQARLQEWPEGMRVEHAMLLGDLSGAAVGAAFADGWTSQDLAQEGRGRFGQPVYREA